MVNVAREAMMRSRACGLDHPALVSLDHVDVLDDRFGSISARQVFGYEPGWGIPDLADVGRPGR